LLVKRVEVLMATGISVYTATVYAAAV